jgi:hypothetical protein
MTEYAAYEFARGRFKRPTHGYRVQLGMEVGDEWWGPAKAFVLGVALFGEIGDLHLIEKLVEYV